MWIFSLTGLREIAGEVDVKPKKNYDKEIYRGNTAGTE